MSFKELKLDFVSIYREIFVYHHRSLEFRAKFFAAIISANKEVDESVYDTLKKIAVEIYGHDERRVEVLVRTTKEYVKKVITENGLNLDQLIFDLDNIIKKHGRYVNKINLNHLRRLQNKDDEDIKLVQQRIVEFAEFEIAQNLAKQNLKSKK